MIKSYVVALIGLLVTLPVQADLRVLLSFDSAGHVVHKVFMVASRDDVQSGNERRNGFRRSLTESAGPLSPIASGRAARHDADSLGEGQSVEPLRPGYARLSWFDERGVRIARTWVADPRATRSPSHVDGVDASRAALDSGAWLVTGPDTASQITIRLPPDFALGLGAEVWEVLIPPPE